MPPTPSPSLLHEPVSTRRTSNKPPLVCRTCLRCRSKKVKCDATQPKCTPCANAVADCTYPPDARRAGRASRADVRALRSELDVLRRIVQERDIQYPSVSGDLGEHPLAPSNSNCSESRDEVAIEQEQSRLQEQRAGIAAVPPSPGTRVYHTSHPSPSLSPSPSNTREQQQQQQQQQHTSYQRTPRNSTSGSQIAAVVNFQHGGEGSETYYQGPLSSEAHIVGAMTEDGEVHVHGVTSTLHEPAAVGTIDVQTESQEENESRIQLAAEYLISNAAIQRQREIVVLSSPDVGNKIDFDGLEPEMALHLLDLHWNRHHLGYLYTYRPAVMDSLINGGPHANKLLLNAIYYASSLFSDRLSLRSDPQDPQTQGDHFYSRFRHLLVDELDNPSIPSASALLLCGSSLVSHGKQSAGWVLCGIAYRMITDLGCHLGIQSQDFKSAETSRAVMMESEMRKRLYWGAFIMDKFQSLYLGRPPALRPSEARVSRNLYDTYEELELWTPYVDQNTPTLDINIPPYQPRPAYAVSTFQSIVTLADITSKVVDSFYSIQSLQMPKDVILQAKLSIERDLEDWVCNLPVHLRFEPNITSTPPPHQITPHTTYWTLQILLNRPFLSTGHLNYTSSAHDQALGAQKCSTAALQIWSFVSAYKSAFTLRRAPYLLSYAIYSAVLVVLHQTDEDNTKFVECMPFFWEALRDLQQGCNSGLKKPLQILKALMQRLGKDTGYWGAMEEDRGGRGEVENGGLSDNVNNSYGGTEENGEGMEGFQFQFSVLGEGLHGLQGAEIDMWTKPQWLDTIAGDQGLMDDSMYGLFTAR